VTTYHFRPLFNWPIFQRSLQIRLGPP